MKYLKAFERNQSNIEPKYNIGDYVYLKNLDAYDRKTLIVPYAKILSIETFKYYVPDYKVEALNIDNEVFNIFPLDEIDIKRYMSDEEIDEYNSLKESIKYNL